jgi:putative SOS response-associated peptidase YedK
MCNRLCVTFSLKELQALIQFKHGNITAGPNYVELGTKLKPTQTYNASTTSPCPILLSEKHVYDGMPSSSVVLAIMQWGLSPSWEADGKAQLKYRVTHTKKESLTRTKTFEVMRKEPIE